ncbi:DUF4058 family protein [Anaerolineales bacterium HSG24]|nr:DUF4058 family protein [Anaerolineales bacterium HSG24]
MPSPFPGMDPYLEDSEIWSGFHNKLANEIVYQLMPLISPKYYADVEIYTASVNELNIGMATHETYPDVGVYYPPMSDKSLPEPVEGNMSVSTDPISAIAIPAAPLTREVPFIEHTRLRTVQIYLTKTSHLITSIEILYPANKQGLKQLENYRHKRSKLIRSAVHLVELDLLRAGKRPGPELTDLPDETDYLLLVNRMGLSRISEIWPLPLNQPFPILPVPLLSPDPDIPLDLNKAVQTVYDRSGYVYRIDYGKTVPPPALRPAMATWVAEKLSAH